jgi:glucoamylase
MANFLSTYIEDQTGLPKPSYDLWEENFITSTYTTSLTYAALEAAAELADAASDADSAVRWRTASEDIRDAARKRLFNSERGYFYKGYTVRSEQTDIDSTIDISSFFGAYMFGLFPSDSDEISTAFATIKSVFLSEGVIGLPRYEHDNYHREDGTGLGNYWYITTLWIAQYALHNGDHVFYTSIMDWIEERADSSSMFAEQINPTTDKKLSVSPLVWSHAEYMTTLLDMLDSQNEGKK